MFATIFLGRSEANLRAAENGDWKWIRSRDVRRVVLEKFASFRLAIVGSTETAAVAGRIKALSA